jgi:hypothetical protein
VKGPRLPFDDPPAPRPRPARASSQKPVLDLAEARRRRDAGIALVIHELWRSQTPIVVTQAGVYTADFSYTDLITGEIVVEDVKGEATKTTDYRLRKRIAELVHGVSIREV